MEIIFWMSVALIAYTYVGYPVVLYVISKIHSRPVKRGDVYPSMSIIISAYNEEGIIRSKLVNTLLLRYKGEREVIVVSDGSTDRTEAIVTDFEGPDVQCVSLAERSGKSIALNEGVRRAKGELIAFTDAGAVAEDNCLQALASNFNDPSVGCVSTEDVILAAGSGSSEGAYVKYEMFLRLLESRLGSCVAVSGSFYVIRRGLVPVFPPQAATDLLSAAETVKKGYRTVSDPRARARLGTVTTQQDEFRRKVRTVLTGLSCLPAILPLLNPFRYLLYSFELFSHKILRWFGGLLLPVLLISNIVLAGDSNAYQLILLAHLAVYALALIGAISETLSNRFIIIRLPYFFFSTNVSALAALFNYICGRRAVVWQPSKRQTEEITT